MRAGGQAAVPKQYWPLGGVAMLTRSIGAFAEHPSVDEILVVVHGDDARLYQEAAAPYAARLRAPVLGGAMRQESVRAGLEALVDEEAPDLLEGHGPDEVFDVDTAVAERAPLPVRLGDLSLERHDTLEARLEVAH